MTPGSSSPATMAASRARVTCSRRLSGRNTEIWDAAPSARRLFDVKLATSPLAQLSRYRTGPVTGTRPLPVNGGRRATALQPGPHSQGALRKDLAAVDDQRLAGDITGFARGQESDCPADILGFPESIRRNRRQHSSF